MELLLRFDSINLKLEQSVGGYYQMCSRAFSVILLTLEKVISFFVLLCFICKIRAINHELR